MYYSFPEAQESYIFQTTQYMFGDDMLVAPITEAASAPVNASLTKTVWLPEGTWADWVSQLAVQNILSLQLTTPVVVHSMARKRMSVRSYSITATLMLTCQYSFAQVRPFHLRQ